MVGRGFSAANGLTENGFFNVTLNSVKDDSIQRHIEKYIRSTGSDSIVGSHGYTSDKPVGANSDGGMLTTRPIDLAPPVTSPAPQPSGVQQPPILSPINYVPGAPVGVSQTPATPITAPSAVFPNAPVSAPTVSAPPNPVAPSPLVDIIDQNPQKPSSLNPNKSQKSTKSGKQGGGTNRNSDRGGSRSGDHYSGVDRNGGFGGSKSSSGGTSSKSSGSGGKSGGSSPKDKGSKSTGKSGGGWGNGNSPGDTARGNGFGGSGPSVGKDPGGRSFQHEGKRDNNQKSKSTGGFGGWGVPVLLDLGNGLAVDPLSSSSFFVDLDGSGYLHRMASAGAGTGMLVLDVGGDGKISDAREFVFTEWDKSATGDLEAVRNVFDTNGNGRLDAGDARWSEFKVLVDGSSRQGPHRHEAVTIFEASTRKVASATR